MRRRAIDAALIFSPRPAKSNTTRASSESIILQETMSQVACSGIEFECSNSSCSLHVCHCTGNPQASDKRSKMLSVPLRTVNGHASRWGPITAPISLCYISSPLIYDGKQALVLFRQTSRLFEHLLRIPIAQIAPDQRISMQAIVAATVAL